MKRAIRSLVAASVLLMMGASAALAQETYPPSGTDGTTVGGGGGTAFTGSDVSVAAMAFVALLVLGLAALFVARRRAARLVG